MNKMRIRVDQDHSFEKDWPIRPRHLGSFCVETLKRKKKKKSGGEVAGEARRLRNALNPSERLAWIQAEEMQPALEPIHSGSC